MFSIWILFLSIRNDLGFSFSLNLLHFLYGTYWILVHIWICLSKSKSLKNPCMFEWIQNLSILFLKNWCVNVESIEENYREEHSSSSSQSFCFECYHNIFIIDWQRIVSRDASLMRYHFIIFPVQSYSSFASGWNEEMLRLFWSSNNSRSSKFETKFFAKKKSSQFSLKHLHSLSSQILLLKQNY